MRRTSAFQYRALKLNNEIKTNMTNKDTHEHATYMYMFNKYTKKELKTNMQHKINTFIISINNKLQK